MLSREQIEAYRRMSQEERWRVVESLMADSWRFLKELPEAERERRLSYDQRRHEEADAIMLEHLRRRG